MGADVVRAEVGDEAQVRRSGGVDGAGLPVRCAAGTHVDLLVAEDERHAALAEDFAPHADHSPVPVDGGVDVAAVEHHVVDAVNNNCHAFLLRQPAAHSLARSSSSRPNSASSPGTIQAKACSACATQSLSDTTAIRLNAEWCWIRAPRPSLRSSIRPPGPKPS